MPAQPDLPLRPTTIGELLDAAISLLRRRALLLLCTAAVLATAEQLVLAPLRQAVGVTLPSFWPSGNVGGWWILIALGFAMEATIITLLGALASAAAVPALLGRPVRDRALWRSARPLATVITAVLLGGACGMAALAGFLPWIFVYGLFGLAAPALVIDRSGNPFSALIRSARLAARSGLRACWVRLGAYLIWFAIRLALGLGWIVVLSTVTGTDPDWLIRAVPMAWTCANTLAYAALACVVAVLLVDTRIRSEGLDIAINRARSRGEDEAAVLVSQR